MGHSILGADASRQEVLVGKLARDTGTTFEEAQRAYEQELKSLAREARIGYYLPVLAAKSAREHLKHRRAG